MTIKIIDITSNPLQRIGEVASACWNSNPQTVEQKKKIAIECIDSGHHRPIESVHITMVIEGYSARMVRELYTHIGGLPMRLQESTRYVDYSEKFDFYIPDSIKNSEEALTTYYNIMDDIQDSYKYLQRLDIPKQDIANILPLGMMTKIVFDVNLRNLLHMAELRMCNRALKEYRDFMMELKNILSKVDDEWNLLTYHYMHPKCEILGYCNEKNSCGMNSKKEDVIK